MTRPRLRAFTLIEVLLAISVVALLGVLIYSAFEGMSRARTNMTSVASRHQAGRQALARMTREISSAFLSAHKNFDALQNVRETGFFGRDQRHDRLDFTTFSHVRLAANSHESDQAELSYFVARGEHGTLDLVRRVSRFIDAEPRRGGVVEVMVEDVEKFELQYLDAITNEWVDSWDSSQVTGQLARLPAQVRITLKLHTGKNHRPAEFETKVPIAVTFPIAFGTD
ncbi:MAG: prepilin-type N-terminal cleavage/methylation domain-containing protein [Myxococcales bacterium]|nr:prepilin-type N-terminal cleavage/methylation domain-containing protein [Myxococcales bacterium]